MDSSLEDYSEQKVVIMIVDDDPDLRTIARVNLTQEGFEVRQATNGVECLEQVKERHPDIILLDLMMPEMDGFEACKRLKSVDSTRNIPVIIMSALSDLDDKLRCFSFKADDYVAKPYDFREVLARIYLHLNRSVDQRERDQQQRTAVLREVLQELSDGIGQQYKLIEDVLDKTGGEMDPDSVAVIRDASTEIIRTVEVTRETEDPFYESPYLDLEASLDEDDEDLEAILEDLPEPPNTSRC